MWNPSDVDSLCSIFSNVMHSGEGGRAKIPNCGVNSKAKEGNGASSNSPTTKNDTETNALAQYDLIWPEYPSLYEKSVILTEPLSGALLHETNINNDDEVVGLATPDYATAYIHAVGTHDIWLDQVLNSIDAATGISVTVSLPGDALKEIAANVKKNRLVLKSRKHYLEVQFSRNVDEKKYKAVWNAKREELKISLNFEKYFSV